MSKKSFLVMIGVAAFSVMAAFGVSLYTVCCRAESFLL